MSNNVVMEMRMKIHTDLKQIAKNGMGNLLK